MDVAEVKGKVLFITHQLSYSGAPLVLMEAIRMMKEDGYEPEVVSLMGGPLSAELDRLRIPWQVRNDFLQDWKPFYEALYGYRAVVVNTLVACQPVILLKHTPIPTVWWLHETEDFFEMYDRMSNIVPDLGSLGDNIHLLSVSPAVQEILNRRYGLTTPILPLCVRDRRNRKPEGRRSGDPVRFLTLGSLYSVKGQDILAKAIRLLPEDLIEQCSFTIVGGDMKEEPSFRAELTESLSGIPQVKISGPVPHEEAIGFMRQCDLLIIPSRRDMFPTVAVEAMSLRKPCILTEACGVTAYLKDGESALFCASEEEASLADRISAAARSILAGDGSYERMARSAEEVYEREFSPAVFRKRLYGWLCLG